MNKQMQTKQLSQWLKESVDWLIDRQEGCCTFTLDDHLAVCIGWSEGYGHEPREDVIQAIDDLDYAVNAALKVWTSDSMRTDLDYINFPYYPNGDIADISVSISKDEDYDKLAEYFLKEYEGFKSVVISDNGEITENPNLDYEIEGRYFTWYEIDRTNVGKDTYVLFESCEYGDEAGAILVKLPNAPLEIKRLYTGELVYVIPEDCEIAETYDDITSTLEDNGIL
jgi:hypothetical protein